MKYSKIVLVSIISLLILVSRSFCVCVGNELGACQGLEPSTCATTKIVVGNSLTSNNDEDKGRTSHSRYPIDFTHNGASASFTVRPLTQGKDVGLSTTEQTCDGSVIVFFNEAGPKTVGLEVHQSSGRNERTLNSSNSFKVIYDNVAPEITLTQVFIGPDVSGAGQAFSAGATFFTSDEVTVRARVVDLDPAVPADQVGAQVISGLREVGQIIPPTAAGSGQFEFPVGLAIEPDGTYNMEIAGVDSITGLFADNSPANTSKGIAFTVIKDSESPVITKLEIIVNPTSEARETFDFPNVFVPSGTFKVRATFSEDMGTAPNLLVQTQGSGFGEVSPPTFGLIDTTLFPASRRVIEYNYTPLNNIENLGALNIGFADNGRDLSGNALDLARGAMSGSSTIDGGSVVNRAAILDLVPPDLKRIVVGDAGSIQSIPRNNQKLPKQGFPTEITVIVGDYNFVKGSLPPESADDLFKTDNASGVDFTRLLDAGASEDAKGIKIEVLNPQGEPVIGTISTKPPNGLVYLFSDLLEVFPPNGFAPAGTYTVRVSMVDKVGNDSVETFNFNIDATDVDPRTIEVSLLPEKPPIGFTPDTGNPLHENPLDGILVPDNPALVDLDLVESVRELASFKVCSTDPTINLTQTEVTMKARLNGPDTVAKTMSITGAVNINDTDNTCGVPGAFSFDVLRGQLKSFPNLNFDFPNPAQVGAGVLPGARDPRFGRFDGPYQVEVIGVDDAGNISDPIVKEFLLDTTPPLTWDTFPRLNAKVSSPIRHVSAEVKDPHPPRLHTFDADAKLNFGSGISQTHSSMKLFLDTPYREDSLNPDLFKGSERELSSFLTYTHRPNAVDPESAGYNPKDDAYKVLLEFTNLGSKVEALPDDGTADGIYRMQVLPVDNSGNSVQAAIDGKSGFQASESATEITTETRKDFVFLLDSIAPVMNFKEINGEQPKKLEISGDNFKVEGNVQDLSAQVDPTKGGSGVARVEYKLVLLTESGSLVPSVEVNGRLRKNPIISGEAMLAPIVDVANDPTVSLTKPMDPATYKDIVLVQRDFTVNALLPVFNDIIKGGDLEGGGISNYFLEVTGFDHSGNETKKTLSVNMNFGKLASPELINPVFGSHSNKTSFNFEFKSVNSATDYILAISRPNGTTTTQIVRPNPNSDIVRELVLLSEKGEYFWWVTARDSVGNLGLPTIKQPFYLDLDRPEVSQVFWSDLTPGSENGKLTLGEFQLSIRFSENLTNPPVVTYKPLSESIENQVVIMQSMVDNIWRGLVAVPRDANYEWDGTATIDISEARDASGNEMFTDRSNTFEIETGPDYEIKLFENPVATGEIVLVLKASESLAEDPLVYDATGVEILSDEVIKIKDKSYSTVFKVPNNFTGIASFRVTGKDLQSNPSTRHITFPIATVSPVNSSILRTRNTRLYIPENTVNRSLSFGLLPQSQLSNLQEDSSNDSSMKKIKDLDLLYPNNVNLNKNLQLTISMDEPLKDKQGLFLKSTNGLQFLSASKSRVVTASINEMGQLLVYEDSDAPIIGFENKDNISLSSHGDKLQLTIEDMGSGIDLANLMIMIDDQVVTWTQLSDVLFEVNVPSLSEGSHNLEVRVQDKVKNASISKAVATVNSILRMKISAFPNPARSFAKIQYDLNVGISYLKLSIYDTSGALVYHTNTVSDFLLNTAPGRHIFEWDLMSSRGNDVKNGVYFVKVSASDLSGNLHKSIVKIAVLK